MLEKRCARTPRTVGAASVPGPAGRVPDAASLLDNSQGRPPERAQVLDRGERTESERGQSLWTQGLNSRGGRLDLPSEDTSAVKTPGVSHYGEALGRVDGRGAPVGGDKLSVVQGRVTGRSHSGRGIHTDHTAFSAKGPSTRSAG